MSETTHTRELEHSKKNARNNFTIIPNKLLRNHYKLHSDELLLLLHLLSHKDGWHSYTDALKETFGWGRDRVKKASSGLISKGFVKRKAKQSADGKMAGWVTQVSDRPECQNDTLGDEPNRPPENTSDGAPGGLKKTNFNNTSNEVITTLPKHISQKAGRAAASTLSGPPNPPEGGTIRVSQDCSWKSNNDNCKPDELDAHNALPAIEIDAGEEPAMLAGKYIDPEKMRKWSATPPIDLHATKAKRDRIAGVINRSAKPRNMEDILNELQAKGLLGNGKDKG